MARVGCGKQVMSLTKGRIPHNAYAGLDLHTGTHWKQTMNRQGPTRLDFFNFRTSSTENSTRQKKHGSYRLSS